MDKILKQQVNVSEGNKLNLNEPRIEHGGENACVDEQVEVKESLDKKASVDDFNLDELSSQIEWDVEDNETSFENKTETVNEANDTVLATIPKFSTKPKKFQGQKNTKHNTVGYTYSDLILLAILHSEDQKIKLNDIYSSISARFPQYQNNKVYRP